VTLPVESFPKSLISLWLRLNVLASLLLLVVLGSWLPGRIGGWLFYLTGGEALFEVAVRVVFVVLIAMALATACALAVAPFLAVMPSSRPRIVEAVTGITVVGAVFGCLAIVLKTVEDSMIGLAHLSWFPVRIVFALYCLAFAAVLCLPRRRKQLVGCLDDMLTAKTTRRAALATGLASAALVAGEFAAGKLAPIYSKPARSTRPRGPNVLLVTFDALSAEDMSLYGYRLPTTPNIDEFARKSTVFDNFYSASTFTTASIASILTGLHPSDDHVHQLHGSFERRYATKTLPHVMRDSGYITGATVGNPTAHFLVQGIERELDYLPDFPHRSQPFLNFWDATRILHQREPFGSRTSEYWDLEETWGGLQAQLKKAGPRLFASESKYDYSPSASFSQARELLDRMPEGFFLWVHLMAPHDPYLPDAPYLHRFLPSGEVASWWPSPTYELNDQPKIDKARLRYDELIAEADGAFGAFVTELERSGRLRDTAVIVTADHGESFEGGVYGHYTEFQNRPEIHVPLVVRMPGQERGYRTSVTADQTSLATTVIDIAGLPRPDWMRGESLVPWLKRDGEGEGQGKAFTQYLVTDSIFKPIRSGTVGVIDGRSQYILDLATGKGRLRSLSEGNLGRLDRSAQNPALVEELRREIYARFPDFPREGA
jgi:arylsulfatase A-like enzyme